MNRVWNQVLIWQGFAWFHTFRLDSQSNIPGRKCWIRDAYMASICLISHVSARQPVQYSK